MVERHDSKCSVTSTDMWKVVQYQIEMIRIDFKFQIQVITYIIYYSTMDMLTYFLDMSLKAS